MSVAVTVVDMSSWLCQALTWIMKLNIRIVMLDYVVQRFRISLWSHFSVPCPCRSAPPFVSFREWMVNAVWEASPLNRRTSLSSADVLFITVELSCTKNFNGIPFRNCTIYLKYG
jgi:hypothetical protein